MNSKLVCGLLQKPLHGEEAKTQPKSNLDHRCEGFVAALKPLAELVAAER